MLFDIGNGINIFVKYFFKYFLRILRADLFLVHHFQKVCKVLRGKSYLLSFHSFVLHQAKHFHHKPVCRLLRIAAKTGNLLKQSSQMSGLCKDSGIIFRKAEFLLVAGCFFLAELRQLFPDLLNPLIRNMDRRKIRVREVTVILGILFGTHCMGGFLVVIPSSGFLDNASARFQKLDLALSFSLNGMCNGLEGVQVLHLGSGSKGVASRHTDRKVDIRTHGALLKLTVGNAQILHGAAKLFQISDNFICASHIRLGNDLDQGNAASVVIHQGAVLPLVMDQLTCVLLHMHLMDPHLFLSCFCLNFYKAIMADWKIQLGNLIVLRVVRVKIVLTVKFAVLIDAAVGGKSCTKGKLYYFFI